MTDNNYDVVIDKNHSVLNDFFIQYLSEQIGHADFLDVGCNAGYLIEKRGHGHGIDASVSMVEKAKAKGLDVQWGDANKLDYADNQFPIVVLSCILEQNPLPYGVLDEALRVASRKVIGINPIPFKSTWGNIGGTKWVKSIIEPDYLKERNKALIIYICNSHYYFEIKKA